MTGERVRSSTLVLLPAVLLTVVVAASVLVVVNRPDPEAACVGPAAETVVGCEVWIDDFDGPAGAPPAPSRWVVETGGLGWGDGSELQAYTDAPSNVALTGSGQLAITARAEEGPGGAEYTSGRISTCGRANFLHGRIEARIRIPAGQGLWPAFWTDGADGDWPEHGEIDIIEALNGMERIRFNAHQPRNDGDGDDWRLPSVSPVHPSGSWADDFHVYAVDWTHGTLTWSVDGVPYATRNRAATPADGRWVLDEAPQILMLNLAVGGWPGTPDETTEFPARMLVDWVRVIHAPSTAATDHPSPPESCRAHTRKGAP